MFGLLLFAAWCYVAYEHGLDYAFTLAFKVIGCLILLPIGILLMCTPIGWIIFALYSLSGPRVIVNCGNYCNQKYCTTDCNNKI